MQLDHTASSPKLETSTSAPSRELASSRLKAILMQRLREMRQSRGMTQAEAAIWFGVSQPRVSHLAQNRVNRFTVDTLINMLALAFRILRICGHKPELPVIRVCRSRFRKSMQDRQRSATHHLAAALQPCQGQAINRRSIQSPQINDATAG